MNHVLHESGDPETDIQWSRSCTIISIAQQTTLVFYFVFPLDIAAWFRSSYGYQFRALLLPLLLDVHKVSHIDAVYWNYHYRPNSISIILTGRRRTFWTCPIILKSFAQATSLNPTKTHAQIELVRK
jgi:hypothetical protein